MRNICPPALLLVIFFSSCKLKADKEQVVYYRAILKNDTAFLKLNIDKASFYGQYEVRYHGAGKDSGDVKGTISHDTLLGDYHYRPFGGGKLKRKPFALLKKDETLFLGKGVIGDFMNIPHYIQPVNYSAPTFVFKEVRDSLAY